MKIKQYLSKILIAGMLLWTLPVSPVDAVVCQPYQGCTGVGTATTTDVGKVLTVASSSPFAYSFTTIAGGATTTINGASGPSFTFNGTANQINIATSTGTVTFSTPQNIATSSTVQFATTTLATTSIQQLTISSLEGILAGLQGLVRTINLLSPLSYSTTTNNLSISQANTSTNGYLSSTDWNTFNTKVSSTTQVIAGTNLTGGGALTGNVTLNTTQSPTFTGTTTLATTTLPILNSYLATNANGVVVATTTPIGGSGFVIPANSTTSYSLASSSRNLSNDANLVSYYQMNDTSDSKGANTLTNNGGVSFITGGMFATTSDTGINNASKYFSRVDHFGLNEAGNQSFSLWFKLDTEITSGSQVLFTLWETSATGCTIQIIYEYNAGSPRLRFYRNGATLGNVYINGSINDGLFHNYILVYNGSNITVYKDGISQGSGNTSGTTNVTNSTGVDFKLFSDIVPGAFISGQVDDFSVWSRELTSIEASDIYAHTSRQYAYSSTTVSLATTTTALYDSNINIQQAGTYLIQPRVNVKYNGATFTGGQTISFNLRRNNNIPTDIDNSTTTLYTSAVTTSNGTVAVNFMQPIIYTTNNNDDNLIIFGILGNLPSAGTVDVIESSIIATRLY